MQYQIVLDQIVQHLNSPKLIAELKTALYSYSTTLNGVTVNSAISKNATLKATTLKHGTLFV